MNKPFAAIVFASFVVSALAADVSGVQPKYDEHLDSVWPSVFAVSEWPASPEVTGIRLSIPFSTTQETVTGFDLGLWGRCRDAEGLQVSIIRNDVKDTLAGIQVGLYNSANRADLMCVQVGLFNETQSFRGVQAGLVNKTGSGEGLQVGVINCAETFRGYQVGVINIIRDAEIAFCPVLNIGF